MLREALTVRAESACHLDAPRAKVWEALIEPDIQLRLDPQVIHAGTVPGTQRGVGEMQFCVRRTDEGTSASVLEVVELEEGHRAVVRAVSSLWAGGYEVTVSDLGGNSCLVRHEHWVTLPQGTHVELVKLNQQALDRTALQLTDALPGAVGA